MAYFSTQVDNPSSDICEPNGYKQALLKPEGVNECPILSKVYNKLRSLSQQNSQPSPPDEAEFVFEM